MINVKERSVGMELRLQRTERGFSLREASDRIGISENYLSEIERDKKNPNDNIVRTIANLYSIDEKELFDMFGRIPLVVQEELKAHDKISRTLYNISTDGELSEAEKDLLYDRIEVLYRQHFNK